MGRNLKAKKLNQALALDKRLYTYRVSLSDIIFVLDEDRLKQMLKDRFHLDEVDFDLPLETPG
jgi:hypothetical protein